ncbi:unnamed protein product, partial [Candidula unifasciata]
VLSDLLTVEHAGIFLLVNVVMVCGVTSCIGIIANAINLAVFVEQGLHNTTTICLFGLAISDICLISSGVPWVALDLVYLTGAWPHHISGRITSYITVFITAERCLCVILPLEVKQIMTPMKTTVALCLIYIINILVMCPEYVTSYLYWKYFPEYNATLLTLNYLKGSEKIAGLIYCINSISGLVSFVSVTVMTLVLVVKLKEASVWRIKAKSANISDAMSSRDQKAVKMVTLIATVMIICFTPGVVVGMVTFIEPEFDIRKTYANTVASLWTIACVFQSVNSSVNIFFYYEMSSKYRQTFHVVLSTWRQKSI